MKRVVAGVVGAIAAFVACTAQAQQTKVVFYTNWYAEAEHGGFYQALAEGLYKRSGLDVDIKMGGPQINVMQLLLAEQADMVMGYDIQTIKAVEQGLPVVTVAATFQKDPVVMLAHPGVAALPDLKTRTLLIGQASETTFWPWVKAKYGFTDEQKRPYAFSVQQFLVDKNVAQQGYLTSEPYMIEKAGITPVVFLLADSGYPPYAETIVATTKTVKDKPEMVRKFAEATAQGWKSYLKNPAPGNALIKKANPEMTEELMAYGVKKMKDYALVTGGDAKTAGILTMTDARWKQTFDFMVSAGMTPRATPYQKAYTLDFIKDVVVLP